MGTTKLQRRFIKAAEFWPDYAVAMKMGISPKLFQQIKKGATVPKQKRVVDSINKYMEEKGL